MAIKEVSGHLLQVGDKVRMNIEALGKGFLDGVEITTSGVNYWRYMNEHPDEVYTVTEVDDESYDECIYVLSGAMGGNTWAADELIHVPEPETMFEVMKNLTIEEAPEFLISMIHELCEEGVPSSEGFAAWLKSKP